jgi:hypothetical protein
VKVFLAHFLPRSTLCIRNELNSRNTTIAIDATSKMNIAFGSAGSMRQIPSPALTILNASNHHKQTIAILIEPGLSAIFWSSLDIPSFRSNEEKISRRRDR